jgi:hypothetical protein
MRMQHVYPLLTLTIFCLVTIGYAAHSSEMRQESIDLQDSFTVIIIDKYGGNPQGNVHAYLKERSIYSSQVTQGRAILRRRCAEIDAILFLPKETSVYEPSMNRNISCKKNPKIVEIDHTNLGKSAFAILNIDLTQIKNNIELDQQERFEVNYRRFQESISESNFPQAAFYANEITAIARSAGENDIERQFSEFAIKAAISGLTIQADIERFVRFDPLQGRSVTTVEGLDFLKNFQENNNLAVSGQWDFQTFRKIRSQPSPEEQGAIPFAGGLYHHYFQDQNGAYGLAP